LPKYEVFALSYYLKKIVISVPANIAEGSGRIATKEYIHYSLWIILQIGNKNNANR